REPDQQGNFGRKSALLRSTLGDAIFDRGTQWQQPVDLVLQRADCRGLRNEARGVKGQMIGKLFDGIDAAREPSALSVEYGVPAAGKSAATGLLDTGDGCRDLLLEAFCDGARKNHPVDECRRYDADANFLNPQHGGIEDAAWGQNTRKADDARRV